MPHCNNPHTSATPYLSVASFHECCNRLLILQSHGRTMESCCQPACTSPVSSPASIRRSLAHHCRIPIFLAPVHMISCPSLPPFYTGVYVA
jgi:hypothetical protein